MLGVFFCRHWVPTGRGLNVTEILKRNLILWFLAGVSTLSVPRHTTGDDARDSPTASQVDRMFPDSFQRWIVAHRGVSDVCPENTRAAFEAAVAGAADAIEFDVQLTGDDQVVVCHDTVLDRYGHASVKIAETSLSVLKQLDIGSWLSGTFADQRLLTLDELLESFSKSCPLLLEVKASELSPDKIQILIDAIVDAIRQRNISSTVAVLCFDCSVLESIHAIAPEISLVLNTNQPETLTAAKLASMPWLTAVDGKISQLTPQIVQLIHNSGLVSSCFTCNDVEDVIKAWDIGVSAIITNHPERTRQILKQHKRLPHDS